MVHQRERPKPDRRRVPNPPCWPHFGSRWCRSCCRGSCVCQFPTFQRKEANMADLKTLEKRQYEDLLGMSGGYVLDFTNRSFADLFRDSVGINIYDAKYSIREIGRASCRE